MKAADVAIYGLTSQTPIEAEKAEKAWGLNYTVYGDPENKLRHFVKEKGWGELEMVNRKGYSHKMAQPGVIALSRERKVLYSWAVRADVSNLQGATGRPNPKEVWDIIQARLSGSTEEMKEPSKYGVAEK
ncbi:uncharacterized protein [Oscarella lobularis]|uniref:uncharacterized protein isoform X1 n=1 Tax=Oscarella lobularis TaxID=121494 RepID=UPI003313B4DE